ncbi:hypothetical protein niasHS_015707 [Heterodera schachtii]|uniref:Fido domain-containing protein n=1 Tax=Heterodera schachtii TaxID=97005 RepID=A0ABD2HPI8_HETSC
MAKIQELTWICYVKTIKRLHEEVYSRVQEDATGVYREIDIYVGTKPGDVLPEDIEERMAEFVVWLNEWEKKEDITLVTAEAHLKLARIHPFEDGNGRMCRLLVNFLLVRNGLHAVELDEKFRDDYNGMFDNGDFANYASQIASLINPE